MEEDNTVYVENKARSSATLRAAYSPSELLVRGDVMGTHISPGRGRTKAYSAALFGEFLGRLVRCVSPTIPTWMSESLILPTGEPEPPSGCRAFTGLAQRGRGRNQGLNKAPRLHGLYGLYGYVAETGVNVCGNNLQGAILWVRE